MGNEKLMMAKTSWLSTIRSCRELLWYFVVLIGTMAVSPAYPLPQGLADSHLICPHSIAALYSRCHRVRSTFLWTVMMIHLAVNPQLEPLNSKENKLHPVPKEGRLLRCHVFPTLLRTCQTRGVS